MKLSYWIRVQSFLKAQKISQPKFAEMVGLNYNTFRGWLYNNRMPDAESACAMAEVIGVTVEYLVKGKCKAGSKKRLKEIMVQKEVSTKIKKLAKKLGEETTRLK